MKKYFKKISALLMAAIMVLTMCATSATIFAAAGKTPEAADTTEATVKNVEAGATVVAYQITKAQYNEGFTGYVAADGVTLGNVVAPTSDEVTGIAANSTLLNSLEKVTMTTDGTEGLVSYTAQLNAGYWLVLVSGGKEVYNPMLIGVYYSVSGSDNTMTSDPVKADSNWTLVTANAYAKSTAPTIEKEIVKSTSGKNNQDNTDTPLNKKGNDIAIGDTVDFKISTNIPSYSKQYETVVVKIEDTLSKGLTLKTDSIKVNDAAVDPAMGTITSSATGFTFTINSDYALNNGGKAVVVTYSAEVNEQVEKNFDPNTNTAKLVYSNDPKDADETKETTDKTYTYTFSIGAALSATLKDYEKKINQIVKVDGEGNVISTNKKESGLTENVTEVSTGATFTLTNNATGKVYESTTGADGGLTFEGLDAGTYTLVETKAPAGFKLVTDPHTVVIDATYCADGRLDTLTITIDGEQTNVYKATYSEEKTTITTTTETVTNIVNTTLGTLPSTGGMGTYLFTIVGVVLMACAAGAFFMSRRKTQK